MPAVKKALTADKGATLLLSVHHKDSNGEPVNLTGHTVTFKLYRPGDKSVVLFQKTAEVTADGYINFKATDEETEEFFPLGTSAWLLEHESPGGDINRLFFGPINTRSGVDI